MEALSSSINRAVQKYINLRRQQAIEKLKENGKFPDLDFSSEEEITKFIDSIFPDTSRSPKNTPTGDLWVDPKVYFEFKFGEEEKQKNDPDYKPVIRCAWMRNRGVHSGKVCFSEVPETMYKYDNNHYDVRCKDCKRNKDPKAIKNNAEKLEEALNGTEVKGSPTNFNSVTISHLPGAAITGLDSNNPTSPVSKDPVGKFLTGESTGDPSPTKAKKTRNSPKPKQLKLTSIKKLPEIEEGHKYYRSKETVEGDTWIISLDQDSEKYNVIGKIIGESTSPTEEDIKNLEELTEEDLDKAKDYKLSYKYFEKQGTDIMKTTSFESNEQESTSPVVPTDLSEAGGKGSDYDSDGSVEDMIRRLEEEDN